MTGLLICAAVVAMSGFAVALSAGFHVSRNEREPAIAALCFGLALIAVALWLAYAAGGA